MLPVETDYQKQVCRSERKHTDKEAPLSFSQPFSCPTHASHISAGEDSSKEGQATLKCF